jgi:hypothetical protein
LRPSGDNTCTEVMADHRFPVRIGARISTLTTP